MPPANQEREAAERARRARELLFHRRVAAVHPPVQPTAPAVLERYRRNVHWRVFPKERMFRELGDVRGMRILDFGCGTGKIAVQLAHFGASVVGFDLSEELIRLAKRRAELDGVGDRVALFAGDAAAPALAEGSFDAVIANEILHHVDVPAALAGITRVLRPGGHVLIYEPVAFSGGLRRLRGVVPLPSHASPDERQLDRADLKHIRAAFPGSMRHFYRILGRLERFLLRPDRDASGQLAWALTYSVRYLDWLLLRVPGTWRYAGVVLIVGQRRS